MSKDKKPAPAESGNPAVRVWPTTVNAVGTIIGSPTVIRRAEGKKRHLAITAAFVVEAGKIGLALGFEYSTPEGVGVGGYATSVDRTVYRDVNAVLECIEACHKVAGFPWDAAVREKAHTHLCIELQHIDEMPAKVEALGVSVEAICNWLAGEETLAVAEESKPRVLSKSKRNCRWLFTDAEKIEISMRQGEANERALTLKDDKTRVMAQFKADIERAEGQRDELGRKATSGYEFRDLPCTCYADQPKPGMKRWVRDDTGETVAEEYMTGADVQANLPGMEAHAFDASTGRITQADEPTPEDGEEGDGDNE